MHLQIYLFFNILRYISIHRSVANEGVLLTRRHDGRRVPVQDGDHLGDDPAPVAKHPASAARQAEDHTSR